MAAMDLTAQLERLNLAPAVPAELEQAVQAPIAVLQAQAKRDAERLKANDLKIQALTLELAHLRRIRYGVKSEALSQVQRDLFSRTPGTKTSPPWRRRSSRWPTQNPVRPSPSRNAPAPAASRCRPIGRASSTATNRTPARVGSAARTW